MSNVSPANRPECSPAATSARLYERPMTFAELAELSEKCDLWSVKERAPDWNSRPVHSILKIAFAVFFIAVAGVCSGAEIGNQEPRLQVAADNDWEFRHLVNEYLQAWSPGCRKFDMALATQFYETTDRFSGYHFLAPIDGPVGWGRYGSEMAKVMSDFDQYTILPNEDDFRLTRDGTHVSTGISYRVVGRNRDRKPLDTRARVLLVWERVNDRWLICREEVTSLMSRSTAAR